MDTNQDKSQFVPSSFERVRRIKIGVLSLSILLVAGLAGFLFQYQIINAIEAVLGWLVVSGFIILLYNFSFRIIKGLQEQFEDQFSQILEQADHYAALVKLGAGFAAAQNEKEICTELARRLNQVKNYEYVAVYLIDDLTHTRVLQASTVKPDSLDPDVLKPGEGLSERPLLDGKLHYSPDVRQEARHVPGLDCGSEVDVPILLDTQALGVLVVESRQTSAFDQHDFDLLMAAAQQAAIAIENTRLIRGEIERRQKEESLRQATAAVTSALEPSEVLSRILDQLEHVVPFDSACVFLWQGDFVIAKAIKGIPNPAEVIEERFPADNALFQLILSTGNPVILADVQGDPRFEGWGGTQQMRGWMGVPLKTRGNIIGYLTLDNLRPGTYDTTMANLAQMFASQAAIALENATLYQTMKDSASRMVVLHRVSQEVVSAGADPERIYLAVHKAAALLMPCEAFVIAILDRKRDMIQAVYMIDRDGRSPSMWIPKDQGLSGHVISSGKAILEHDYLFSDDLREMRAIHFGSKDEVRAVLAVPMRLGKDVFGMLSAQSYDPGVYSPEDQSLLEMLAAYATIALENARLFREIQRLATIDGLTDTYNRRHFFELAEREIARSQRYKRPLSIIMLDIDYYKNINDTYGHAVGDEALREIAANLEKNLRESDVLGRYGGDEFSILLPETTLEQAIESAERLRKYIEKRPIVVNEMILHTSISLGVTSIDPQQTATAHENNNIILSDLLLCADMALYEAKSAGRNNVKSKPYPAKP